jgi:Putative transposase/Transposase zinc-binding domain
MTQAPPLSLADIVRSHGAAFLRRHGGWLSTEQKQALRAVARCRTQALGGHVWQCRGCGQQVLLYNSCRNRHCPQCQAGRRARWVGQQQRWLLPVDYYHVVFTLPQEVAALAEVCWANRRQVYELLFRAASATVQAVAADPRHLGAQVGLLLVLHTWGQNLHHHPHVHGLATGGGLSCDASGRLEAVPRWVSCRPGFFLPVRVLSRVFRGKYLALLQEAVRSGQVQLPAALQQPGGWPGWLAERYRQEWVVYAKEPFGGPEVVLKYLGRYVQGVALSNRRLQALEDGEVIFTAKDYREGGKPKRLRLAVAELLRRWVQHVLPRGFVKVRTYGLLGNRQRQTKVELSRWLLWWLGLWSLGAWAGTAEPGRQGGPLCEACGEGLARVGVVDRAGERTGLEEDEHADTS